MATASQTFANRENSKKSTGPRTPEGKAASSSNAKTHGFNARDPVLSAEDRDEFNALLEQFKSDNNPSTGHEQYLVHQMASVRWKLNRLEQMENEMFSALEKLTLAFTDPDTRSSFNRLDRYRAGLERDYHRCARELRAARKEQNEANSTEHAENKFQNLLKRMFEAPPPGFTYEPRLVPIQKKQDSPDTPSTE